MKGCVTTTQSQQFALQIPNRSILQRLNFTHGRTAMNSSIDLPCRRLCLAVVVKLSFGCVVFLDPSLLGKSLWASDLACIFRWVTSQNTTNTSCHAKSHTLDESYYTHSTYCTNAIEQRCYNHLIFQAYFLPFSNEDRDNGTLSYGNGSRGAKDPILFCPSRFSRIYLSMYIVCS